MNLNLRLKAADWVWCSIVLTSYLCCSCWWSWCRPHLVCSPPGQLENWKIGIQPPPAPGCDLVWELSRMRNIVTRVLDTGDTSVYHEMDRHSSMSPIIRYLNALTRASPINMLSVRPLPCLTVYSHDCCTTVVPVLPFFSINISRNIFMFPQKLFHKTIRERCDICRSHFT